MAMNERHFFLESFIYSSSYITNYIILLYNIYVYYKYECMYA